MPTELAGGVHAVPQTADRGERTMTIHPAAVETPRGLLLVDVGLPGEEGQLADHLAALDADWEDVWAVLLTHQDGDHAGALASVCDAADPAVFAHPECAPFVDGRRDPLKGDGDRYPPARVDVEVTDGTTFATAAGPMEVVFTPGHAPGHVSLYLPDAKVLLAADAVTAADGTLRGPNEQFTLDVERAAASVGTLADRDVERVLCYHGGAVEATADDLAAVHEALTG